MADREVSPLTPVAGAGARRRWIRAHAAGLVALMVGLSSFVAGAIGQPRLMAAPDWHVTVPCLIAAALATAVSLVRRESSIALPLVGLGLAAVAAVLGWFLVVAIIVAATAAVIVILHQVM